MQPWHSFFTPGHRREQTMSAESEAQPTPESIAKYVKQNMQKARRSSSVMAMMEHEGGQEIVREDDYKGHHLVIRTRYNITVDGKEVTGHIMLTNAGQVQYHGLPNHSFDSTVDLVRALIDNFPEDFEKGKRGASSRDRMGIGGRGGHPTGGNRRSIGGMKMLGMGVAKSPKAALKKNSISKSKRRTAKSKSK
jgi:hypothetical protein